MHSHHLKTELLLELFANQDSDWRIICPEWESESILVLKKYASYPNPHINGRLFMEEPFEIERIDFDPPRQK